MKSKIEILKLNDGLQSFTYILDNCELVSEKETFSNLKIEVTYDVFGGLLCSYYSPQYDDMGLKLISAENTRLVNASLGLDERILPISANGMELKMVPKESRLRIGNGKRFNRAAAYLINGPKILTGGNLATFKHDRIRMKLTETQEGKDAGLKKRDLKKASVVTHQIEISSLDKHKFTQEELNDALNHFRKFLTLVRGGYVGIGHIFGLEEELISHVTMGFQHSDDYKLPPNWFDICLSASLSNLYQKYTVALSKSEDVFPILRSLEFYRASNTVQSSTTEVALVSSYAALETIVPHLLQTHAGWSKELLNKNSRFSDQIRAAASYIRLISDPFENLPELKKANDNHNKKTGNKMDAYDCLALYRNRMTHPKANFDYGFEIYEAWNLSQWLLEIFIFYLLGYSDEMQDRRNRTGYAGSVGKVPVRMIE